MKNKHAAILGKLGGKARASKTSKERLTEIAMMGVAAKKAKKVVITGTPIQDAMQEYQNAQKPV